ncbi:MAG: hypothetical protein LBC83_01385 [Oscillospiraceae bacterium]|nr:hypothetical protein [Oscillospiraceae bacterium]
MILNLLTLLAFSCPPCYNELLNLSKVEGTFIKVNAMEPPKLPLRQRIALLLAGTPLIAFAVGLFLFCRFGTDPSVTLFQGLSAALHIPLTAALLLVNVPVAVVCLIVRRSLLGAGSILNMLLIGPSAEFVEGWAKRLLPEAGIPLRAGLFAFALLILTFGLALYVAANLGMPPIDTISLMIARRAKLQFRWIRIIQDATAIGIGIALGIFAHAQPDKLMGPGTAILALGVGPLMQFWMRLLFARRKQQEAGGGEARAGA